MAPHQQIGPDGGFFSSPTQPWGCPCPPSVPWGFHPSVTAAADPHPPRASPLPGTRSPCRDSPPRLCLSVVPSFADHLLFSTAVFSALSPLLLQKKNPLCITVDLGSSLCLSGTPTSFYPFGFYNTDISLLVLVYFFSALLVPHCCFPFDCCLVS